MSATTVSFACALVYHHPQLLPILEDHLEANDGEVLPHLLLSDVIRFAAANWSSQPAMAASIMRWIDNAYACGDEATQELIVVSGVEMIPDPGEAGSELRHLLGEDLRVMDPWHGS
ncbi:DUF7674 family protein [Sporichthya polymorpha]|uniref:DUF7674 family protein n=1 Tax=Sporichthya polymorpha TaxID=35751 RepID=UPI00035ED3E8|nr:hypothetical protein [Sporichthya polymorpha]